MNTRRRWLRLASLFVACFMVGVAVPATLALMVHRSNTIVNAFGAEYTAPADAVVTVHLTKTMHDLGTEKVSPEGFRFLLEKEDGTPVHTLITDADGRAAYALTFTDADLRTAHTFRVKEMDDARAGITYDDTVYTIAVRLAVNDENQIVASTFVNGRAARQVDLAFQNVSHVGEKKPEAPVPHTGDDTNLALYIALLLLSATGMVCLLKKQNARVRK